jgi:succinate-semialdehyde dehydrogenase/glutarate-semialdehyde dehydrogenase
MPQAIGGELTSNHSVRKLSFTGSTRVGQLLMQQSASTVKRVSFELGGNAPFIVFDDADVDLAVAGLMASKFRNGGQTCVCANRVLVQDGIYDKFADRLLGAASKLVVGSGLREGVTVGPLINRAAVDKVRRHIDDALSNGAALMLGGKTGSKDQFVEPTVLSNATVNMQLAKRRPSVPSLLCSASITKKKRSRSPTLRHTDWRRTSTPPISTAHGVLPNGSSSAWSA